MLSIRHKAQTFYSKSRKLISHHRILFIILVIHFAVGILLIQDYSHQINPDGVSYITIAEKYSHGDIRHAVNGYWGPLLSWLTAPSFWLGINPISWIKFVQVLAGAGIVVFIYRFMLHGRTSWKKQFQKLVLGMVLFAISMTCLSWALPGPITSDLLLALLTMACADRLLLLKHSPRSLKNIFEIGIIGALMYFSKSAGLPIFIGLWLSIIIYDLWASRTSLGELVKSWRLYSRQYLPTLIICAVLILPFVLAISLKYRTPTLGTSSTFNLSLVGPNTEGFPMNNRLIAPPNKTAVSIWEDISTIKVRQWNPLRPRYFSHLRKLIWTNYQSLVNILVKTTGALFTFGLVYLLTKRQRRDHYRLPVILLSASVVTTAIYLPIFIETRYVMALILSILVMAGLFTNEAYKKGQVALSFVVLMFFASYVQAPIQTVLKGRDSGLEIYESSLKLSMLIPSGANVASDDFGSIYACYYAKARCFGVINLDATDLKLQLSNNHISYVLLLPESAKRLKEDQVKIEQVGDVAYMGRGLFKLL